MKNDELDQNHKFRLQSLDAIQEEGSPDSFSDIENIYDDIEITINEPSMRCRERIK